jgi:hypothetical protein
MKAKTKIKIAIGVTVLAFFACIVSLAQVGLQYVSLEVIVSLATFVTLIAFAVAEYRSGAPKRLLLEEARRFRSTVKRPQGNA